MLSSGPRQALRVVWRLVFFLLAPSISLGRKLVVISFPGSHVIFEVTSFRHATHAIHFVYLKTDMDISFYHPRNLHSMSKGIFLSIRLKFSKWVILPIDWTLVRDSIDLGVLKKWFSILSGVLFMWFYWLSRRYTVSILKAPRKKGIRSPETLRSRYKFK